ncbi:MAG: DNRLRE domain-containing protein, partial [Clostridia bacterium]|nr:DNRLRE domain-containing protein [Clostridia bacterium]
MKFKRLTALVLSFVMIAASAISTTTVFAASESKVQFEEDFEKTTINALTISAKEGSVAEIVNDPDYGKSLHLKSGSGDGRGVSYSASIGNFNKSGVLSFSIKYAESVDWTSLYFGGAINTFITNGRLGMHLGSTQPGYVKLSPNEWHDIEIHFDVPANTIDLYVDYERVASGVKFRSATSFNQWTVNVDKKNNDFYIDNIYFTYSDETKGAPAATTTDTTKEEVKVEETTQPAEPEKVMYEAQEGETVTVAKADTFIGFNSGRNAAQGAGTTISVTKDNSSNEKISFVKFEAPEVPAGKKAYLNLWLQSSSGANVPFTVYATETNWDETLHYADDYIKLLDTVGRRDFTGVESKKWVKIDVTDYVRANAGKEISLSLRGNNVSGSASLNFDSIQGTCKPNILVCDPIEELEIKAPEDPEAAMEAPFANQLSIANLSNVRSLSEINMYVIGNGKTDISLYNDVYGTFADKIAAATGARVNYINKGYQALTAVDGKDKAACLTEDQVADLLVVDFNGITEAQAMDIVTAWRNFNHNIEFIFVADEVVFNLEGTVTTTRAKLLGAEITDAKGGAAKAYIAAPTQKWNIKEKAAKDVVNLLNFDDFDGNNMKNQFLYENADYYYNAEDDNLIGGKYLRIKKDTARGTVATKYFATTVGGNLRFDFQIRLLSAESAININMYPTARDSYKMDSMAIGKQTLQLGANLKAVASLELNKWYNIAVLYDMHTNKYDVLVNGTVVAEEMPTAMSMGNICSYEFDVNAGSTADFALDGVRISYYTDAEKPAKVVEEVADDGPAILFENDFEKVAPGLIEKGTSGDVSYVREDGNTFIRATRTTGNGSCSTLYNFGTTKGDVTLDLDFRLGDLSGATKLMYIMSGGTFAVPIYFSGSQMQLNISASERPVVKKGLVPQQWYHLTITTDLANTKYSINIDGEDLGSYELLGGVTSFDRVRVSISAGENSTYDVDNMKIEKLNTVNMGSGNYTSTA